MDRRQVNDAYIGIEHSVDPVLLDMRLIDMRCKHALLGNWRADEVIRLSAGIGYDWAKWGSHSGHDRIEYHCDVVMKMELDGFEHPERIVVCDYAFHDGACAWIDNMHSAVMYVRRYGMDVRLGDIPFYIVDIRGGARVLRDNGTGIIDAAKASGAVASALKRKQWSESERLIGLGYTFGDLLLDNPLLLQCREFFGTDGSTRGAKKRLDVT